VVESASANTAFGNVLRSVTINEVRGFSAAVELQWPVVAVGGANGSGKTTVLQAASAAYSEAGRGSRHYKLGRWIGPALQGETPAIGGNALIQYSFWDATPTFNVPYQPANTRWRYPRRGNPARRVYFVGAAQFSPRIERQDRTHQNRARLTIAETAQLGPRITESVSRILGAAYGEAVVHTVRVAGASWTDEIPQLQRGTARYTESHMGAGEQKIVRLVRFLESLPRNSLILLEEPELMLHPDAQRGLAWYLMTLARRNGHQIIIATHSPAIFEVLPAAGRVLLVRDRQGVTVLHGISHLTAARQLAGSVMTNQDMLFVEDMVAKRFLQEILRRFAPDLLRDAVMIDLGSAQDIQRMVARLRPQGVRAVAIRDGDHGEHAAAGLLAFPGGAAPETLLLEGANIARAETFIGGIRDAYERARVAGAGYAGTQQVKRIFGALAREAGLDPGFVSDRLTLAYLSDTGNATAAEELVRRIRTALDSVTRPQT
jgi:predicted ATPase